MRNLMRIISHALLLASLCMSCPALAQIAGGEDPAWSVPDSRALPPPSTPTWNQFAVLPDGRVLVAGLPTITRLNANGERDAGFASNRAVNYPLPSTFTLWALTQMLVDPLGRIYLAGFYHEDRAFAQADRGFAVIRLRPDGVVDNSYGNAGITRLLLSDGGFRSTRATQVFLDEGPSQVEAAALQPDGKLLLLGTGQSANDPDFDSLMLVLRLTESGQLDTTFGDSGAALIPLDARGAGRALTVTADGGIVIAGTDNLSYGPLGEVRSGFRGFLFKLTSRGVLDEDFGTDGKFTLAHPLYSYEARATALQQDGRIVVSGARCSSGTQCESLVFRVTPTGVLDRTLGAMGISVQNLTGNSEKARHVAIDGAGNILIAGEIYTAQANGSYEPGFKHFLARLSPSGLLDPDFVWTNLASYEGSANDLAVLDSGVFLLAALRDTANARFYFTIRKFITATPPASGSLSSQQQPVFSGFRVDALDARGAFVDTAPLANRLGLHGYIHPQAADLNATAQVFVAVATPRGWYMRDSAGNFVPWSTRLADLVPALTNVTLGATTYVPVYAGRLPFAGVYRLYLGYRRADRTDVIYMDEAALLTITP